MKIPGLRSAHDEVGGIVYFGRMLDKIRLSPEPSRPTTTPAQKSVYAFDARCNLSLEGQVCRFERANGVVDRSSVVQEV